MYRQRSLLVGRACEQLCRKWGNHQSPARLPTTAAKYLPARQFSIPTEIPLSSKSKRCYLPVITNLDPNYVRKDEILDLSALKRPSVPIRGSDASPSKPRRHRLVYERSKGTIHPYPPNCRGWLYFHRRPNSHPLTGELRFRILDEEGIGNLARDSDIQRLRLFAEGKDLLRDTDNATWRVSVSGLYRTHRLIYDLLVTQNLIPSSLHLEIERSLPVRERQMTILEKITDPFLIDFSKENFSLRILQAGVVKFLKVYHPFKAQRNPGPAPYSGKAWVRFELADLPYALNGKPLRHSQTSRVLVMRVLDFSKPPNPDDAVFQIKGELAKKFNPRTNVERTWFGYLGRLSPSSIKALEEAYPASATAEDDLASPA